VSYGVYKYKHLSSDGVVPFLLAQKGQKREFESQLVGVQKG